MTTADRSYVDHRNSAAVKDARWSDEPRQGLRPELAPGTVLFTVEDVLTAVAPAFQFQTSDLLGRERTRSLVEARDVCCWLLRRHSRLSLLGIAKALGRTDHATTLRAIERCDAHRADDAWLRDTVDRIEREIEAKAKGEVAA